MLVEIVKNHNNVQVPKCRNKYDIGLYGHHFGTARLYLRSQRN